MGGVGSENALTKLLCDKSGECCDESIYAVTKIVLSAVMKVRLLGQKVLSVVTRSMGAKLLGGGQKCER